MKKKIITLIMATVLAITPLQVNTTNMYAHSGRTDSQGGHRDNKNASGLGSYHYHCGGYPAHLHENGVCPYKSNNTTSNVTPTKAPVTAKEIQISCNNSEIEMGETTKVVATVSPSNAQDKSVSYQSSNPNIATISADGTVTAIAPGTTNITATTVNGIAASIQLQVLEIYPEQIQTTDSISMMIGDSYPLEVTVLPENAYNKTVTITPQDENLIKIENNTLKAVKDGQTKVVVSTWNGIEKTIPVIIESVQDDEKESVNPDIVKKKKSGTKEDKGKEQSQDDSSATGGILFLALLTGGIVWFRKRHKKNRLRKEQTDAEEKL